MKRISHGTYTMIAGVIYLALITNVLLVVSCLPLVILLITTDPALSWPMLAAAAPLCAPGLTAAFATFRAFGRGGVTPARTFLAAWRTTWRHSLVVGAAVTGIVVIFLADIRFFSDSPLAIAVVPALGVLTALVAATGLLSLVAIADEPRARLRDVVKASIYLGVRNWHLTIVSLAVLATQIVLFTSLPAVALGLTAAPALYLAWANSRYSLLPVLEVEEAPAV
ncbi:putative membrane protein YesL [Glaciihabitans tibetensis]|uniref:Putative membrane protein YesL n=1 Tax=Glaciihabitans tibetensis TaxID=1266600 RepID=A0A2T0VE14_9MICO|nr:ferredoxin-NADPH reductase [Glaciihabitans tibetensis]PRY68413.1 putative membrane protein YesL [Glaciihabitans tibetensis]